MADDHDLYNDDLYGGEWIQQCLGCDHGIYGKLVICLLGGSFAASNVVLTLGFHRRFG